MLSPETMAELVPLISIYKLINQVISNTVAQNVHHNLPLI